MNMENNIADERAEAYQLMEDLKKEYPEADEDELKERYMEEVNKYIYG